MIRKGRVELCQNSGLARNPLQAGGIHLYSAEELRYYLQHHLYSVDETFFNSNLQRFLSEEIQRPELSEMVMKSVAKLEPVVLAAELALAIGGMTSREKESLEKKKEEFRYMSESAKRKLRADFYLEQGEYDRAFEAYDAILKEAEGRRPLSAEEHSEILRSVARIYTMAFRWKDAADLLLQAYELKPQESVLQELYELCCVSPVEVCSPEVFSEVHIITRQRWQESFKQKQKLAEEQSTSAEDIAEQLKSDFRKISKSCCQDQNFSV